MAIHVLQQRSTQRLLYQQELLQVYHLGRVCRWHLFHLEPACAHKQYVQLNLANRCNQTGVGLATIPDLYELVIFELCQMRPQSHLTTDKKLLSAYFEQPVKAQACTVQPV